MAMEKDGDKFKGRFLKKGSPLYKKMKIIEFSFNEMNVTPVSTCDNPYANILHHRFHRPEDITSAISSHRSIDEEFIEPHMRPPVMYPRDFTGEWLEEKRKAKKRSSGQFADDDEYEMAIEEEEMRKEEHPAYPVKEVVQAVEKGQIPLTSPLIVSSKIDGEKEAGKPNQDVLLEQLQSPQKNITNSLDVMGKAMEELHPQAEVATQVLSVPAPEASFIPMGTHQDANLTPTPALDSPSGEDISYPEKQAMEKYYNETLMKDREKHFQEAKELGFNEGFQEGLEKAEEETQDQVKASVDKVQEMLKSLEGFKKSALTQAQENFYQLAQTLCEALVSEKIKINHAVFMNILKKAIEDNVHEDKFTIRVSPKMFQDLSKIPGENIVAHLVEDSSLELDQFKIETELTTVDGNLQKIIHDMIENANLTLFETQQEHE